LIAHEGADAAKASKEPNGKVKGQEKGLPDSLKENPTAIAQHAAEICFLLSTLVKSSTTAPSKHEAPRSSPSNQPTKKAHAKKWPGKRANGLFVLALRMMLLALLSPLVLSAVSAQSTTTEPLAEPTVATTVDDCVVMNEFLPSLFSNVSCCQQSGITCNTDSRVTKMYIHLVLNIGRDIYWIVFTGCNLPDSIGSLFELEYFRLNNMRGLTGGI
jgi:hypothetical protein